RRSSPILARSTPRNCWRLRARSSSWRLLMSEALLSVKDLAVTFGRGRQAKTVIDGVTFDLAAGETMSLVGESGSGKTTIGRAVLGLAPVSNGSIAFRGR